MSRRTRVGIAATLLGGAIVALAPPASAAKVPCPEKLAGIPLDSSWSEPDAEGIWAGCNYSVWNEDRRGAAWVYFDPTGEAGADTGGFVALGYCLGYGNDIVPTETWSETHRAYSNYVVEDGFPEGPVRGLASDLLAFAEGEALACPDAARGDAPTDAPTPAPEASVGPVAGGAGSRPGGGRVRPGSIALLTGGLLTAGAAGVGARRRRRADAPPPPAESLYSGSDAVRILRDAGWLEEVRGGDGAVIGYRPVRELRRFIGSTPQWQPAFDRPISTPSGAATHLGAVAFGEHTDGLIRDITIAVREGPRSHPSAPDAGTPRPVEHPGEPLSERLGRVWAEAVVRGLPLDLVLEGPISPPSLPPDVPPLPASPPSSSTPPPPARSAPTPDGAPPQRPPADPSSVPGWLASPGWKAIRPEDLHRLLPDLFSDGGTLKPFPFAGVRPRVRIEGGRFSVEVSSPLPFAPDVRVSGAIEGSGGHLVPDLDEVSVGGSGYGDIAEHRRRALQHLDRFTKPVRDAGLSFADVRLDGGELRLLVQPPAGR